MDEKKGNDIMETSELPATPPPLTWRDGAIPLMAVALAWLFWACLSLQGLELPHLGVLVLVCAHFAAVFITLGKRVRLNGGSVFCTAAALALGVSCGLYDSDIFLLLNCVVILLTAAMGTFSLSGHLVLGRHTAVWDTVCLSLAAFFTRLGRPFQVLGCLGKNTDRKRLGLALLGILAAIPVLAVVLWLLASADAVFSSLFDQLDLSLPENAILRTVRVVILALFLCSALWFIREDAPEKTARHGVRLRHATLFLPVTALLDIVYIIFCYIQIKYLFGGAKEASMAGGWAEYARSGFFQLVTITFINLGVILLGTDAGRFASRGGKLLRVLYGLLLALTAVILVSAFWRMRLYIDAFGMSILRLLTLWAMAAVCFSLLAAALKLARPGFGFFRAAGTFALALWCCMNLAGPGRMIANYNVDSYLAGQLSEIDTSYLRELGYDARTAAEKLADAGELDSEALLYWQICYERPWAQRSLSAWRAEQRELPVGKADPGEKESAEYINVFS